MCVSVGGGEAVVSLCQDQHWHRLRAGYERGDWSTLLCVRSAPGQRLERFVQDRFTSTFCTVYSELRIF